MFDFSAETKDKYFTKAEDILRQRGLQCFGIERTRITIVKNESIKVYLKPFTKQEISNAELALIKALPEFYIIHDRHTRIKKGTEKPRTEEGYFLIALEEDDR